MEELRNFRSAFNGFNREDVVHYIEYTNTRHEAQLAQLRGELKTAQAEVEALRITSAWETPEDSPELAELRARCEALEQRNAQLEQENADLKQASRADPEETENLRRELAEVTRQWEAAMAQAGSRTQEELAAYRRAERTERMARDRVREIYHQANGALADAGASLFDAARSMDKTVDETVEKLDQLQSVIAQSRTVLEDAVKILSSIHPEQDEG